MTSRALPDELLRPFLRRRRRRAGEPLPLGVFLEETMNLTARLIPCQAGSLVLDDPARRRGPSPLTFVAAFGPVAFSRIGARVPIGKGIIGHVYRNGTSYATVRPAADPHFSAAIDDVPSVRSRSVAAAPVRLESHVCGVLELVNRRGRKGFGARDMQLLDLLAGYVSRAILNAVDILKQNELALHDDLTGLRNVRGLQGELLRTAEEALASDDDFTVIFVDVDRLKRINDGLGHRAGSEALRRTARGIARACGARALPFRFGGDEFVVLCPGCDLERGMRLAQRIQEAVRRATEIKGGGSGGGARMRTVELSLGVASRKSTVIDEYRPARLGERLMSSADHALYRAKRAGRNRVVAATERDDTLSRTNGAARFSTGERP